MVDEKQTPQGQPEVWDRILAKYVMIWIWSILVGINTSLTFNYIGFGFRSRGAFLLILLVPLAVVGVIFVLGSWVQAVNYLRLCIFPQFFRSSGYDFARNPEGEKILTKLAQWIIFAIGFRMMLAIVDLALSSFTF